MKTPKEVMAEFRQADEGLVQSFNDEFWGGCAPIEAQISFLRARLMNTMKALCLVVEATDSPAVQENDAHG